MKLRTAFRHVVPVLIGALLFQMICSTRPPSAAAQGSITRQQVIDYLDNLRLTDASALISELEARWSVQASAPVVVVGPGPVEAPPEQPPQTEFDVLLKSFGAKKIDVIKAVRVIMPGLGLKEAKTLVESAPVVIKENVSRDEADATMKALVDAGAEVELR